MTLDIQVLRRKIVSAQYEMTQHAKEEAAEDDLDVEDVECIILTGKITEMLTKDPRGARFVVSGRTTQKKEAAAVCRFLSSGKMRIITVYLKRP
jgi:hypothetical protein